MVKDNPIYTDLDVTSNHNKDWRHAFLEKNILSDKDVLSKYNGANAIKIYKSNFCSEYNTLCAYVSQFSSGGFWFTCSYDLYFVTAGYDSDEDATYEDALAFIERRVK